MIKHVSCARYVNSVHNYRDLNDDDDYNDDGERRTRRNSVTTEQVYTGPMCGFVRRYYDHDHPVAETCVDTVADCSSGYSAGDGEHARLQPAFSRWAAFSLHPRCVCSEHSLDLLPERLHADQRRGRLLRRHPQRWLHRLYRPHR